MLEREEGYGSIMKSVRDKNLSVYDATAKGR